MVNNLKKLRKLKGISQGDLAHYLEDYTHPVAPDNLRLQLTLNLALTRPAPTLIPGPSPYPIGAHGSWAADGCQGA